MANPYYNNDPSQGDGIELTANTLARAFDVEDKFDGVAVGFDRVKESLDEIVFAVRLLGSLDESAELPATGNTSGDAYLINGDFWVWDGEEWVDTGPIGSGSDVTVHEAAADPHTQYARKAQNLADLTNAVTARGNLGIAGTVLQVKTFSATSTYGIETTDWTDIALSGSITPASTSSKILIMLSVYCDIRRAAGGDNSGFLRILRGAAVIAENRAQRHKPAGGTDTYIHGSQVPAYFLDSPNTASEVTYSAEAKPEFVTDSGSFVVEDRRTMILMEIAA